jgi:hypothetical protein
MADEEAARQDTEDARVHLVLARGCKKRGDGRRDAEAPESSRIAAATTAAPLVGYFTRAVFSSQCEKFHDTVAFSFVCGNYCSTMN